jgi:phosphoribosyl-ATP pyrophosphohydrolase
MANGGKKSAAIQALERVDPAASGESLSRLFMALGQQRTGKVNHARTAKLLASGLPKMSQKLVEEAAEVAIDAVRGQRDKAVLESADLLYHLTVLWFALGIEPAEVWSEMDRREQLFGIAEKLPK